MPFETINGDHSNSKGIWVMETETITIDIYIFHFTCIYKYTLELKWQNDLVRNEIIFEVKNKCVCVCSYEVLLWAFQKRYSHKITCNQIVKKVVCCSL